jgi:Tol biopolymer transport system component
MAMGIVRSRLATMVGLIALSATACTGIARVSTGFGGIQANGWSDGPFLDQTGRLVAFESSATNLVANDTNNVADAFVKDTETGAISRVSVSSNETQANGASRVAGMSADGRYVAFISHATNLTTNSSTGAENVFLRDRHTGSTRLLSKAPNGDASNGDFIPSAPLSADGSKLVFESDANNLVKGVSGAHAYLVDVASGAISVLDKASECPYASQFANLATVNGDGSSVAWAVECSDQALNKGDFRVYVRNLTTASDTLVLDVPWTDVYDISNYALALSFAGSSSRLAILRDEQEGVHGFSPTTYISTGGTATAVTTPDQLTSLSLSPDGHYLGYETPHEDYLSSLPYTKVAILDLRPGGTRHWVSVNEAGAVSDTEPNADSFGPSWSGDGKLIAFSSNASDIVPNDTNDASDVFTRTLAATLADQGSATSTTRVTG